jgi:hypothetical protein
MRYQRLPARVFFKKFLFFCLEFFCAQVYRHTDTAVFDENPAFERTLLLAVPACTVDLVIAVMIYLREPLTDCAFPCIFP